LFGQGCFEKGMAKNTYGTGCFLLMNTGEEPQRSSHGLLTTIACGYQGKVTYALEGSIFVAGSALQWLRDQMKFFPKSSDSEEMAAKADPNSGVIVVPAFTGLGAPYWDDKCRGAIFGLTRGTSQNDITKATLDSLAYQTRDVLDAMVEDCGSPITELRVDGGASQNNYLLQFQSDLLQCKIQRPSTVETTALGAAYLAGLAVGFWKDTDELSEKLKIDREFNASMDKKTADHLYSRWQKAVEAARCLPAE
jgi:glycerol kinase